MADTAERMLHTDAFSWYMESDSRLRSTVVAVALLDRAVDWDYLRDRVDRMTRLVPHFRARVESPPLRLGPPRWIVDDDFDLDYHLRRVRLPEPSDWQTVLEQARIAAMADFDRDRPLWEVTLLEGLADGRVALITKTHHALSDGIGGPEVLALVVDGTREMPTLEMPPAPSPDGGGIASHTLATLRDDLAEAAVVGRGAAYALARVPRRAIHPVGSGRDLLRGSASVARIVRPILHQASPLLTRRTNLRELTTMDAPVEELHSAAARGNGHVNDAFLAGLLGGLRQYHDHHGADLHDLRVTMPLSIRRPGDAIGGNRITLLRFALPANVLDPIERIEAIGRVTRAWRREPAIAHTQAIAFGLNLVPRSYIQGVLRRVDFLASDVPGLTEPVFLAGAKVLAYYPFGPTIGTALNATLMSYAGTANIGLNLDAGAVPDTSTLVECLGLGFKEVPSAA
ncbi:MAG TPA: wax ester/triacylglycerol synthase domain-containing protein [Mycobacteriales bacterium]|nr:wax ester/triacylglycerol synthase domain-containing protein [Mycobacteriales bacterium]